VGIRVAYPQAGEKRRHRMQNDSVHGRSRQGEGQADWSFCRINLLSIVLWRVSASLEHLSAQDQKASDTMYLQADGRRQTVDNKLHVSTVPSTAGSGDSGGAPACTNESGEADRFATRLVLVLFENGRQGPHTTCIGCGLRLCGIFVESVAY
jgi:hypothetical protein